MQTNKINLLTVGADVEFFLVDKKTGKPVSSEGITKGSKYSPHFFNDDGHSSTSLDNVATEITIPPAKNAAEFSRFLTRSVRYVEQNLPEGLGILMVPAVSFDEESLMTENAMMFGCEPDYNAWTGKVNNKPLADDWTLRSAGGHLHCGIDNIEVPFSGRIQRYKVDSQRANIVQVLDLFVSIPLVIMEPDNRRKELYGKAGAFRPKPYGLEYRTVSNHYMRSDKLKRWAYSSVQRAFDYINEYGFLGEGVGSVVRKSIDTNNKEQAENLIREFRLQLA